VRATKLYERPRVRSQARLALACLRAFWPVRDYWLAVLPASVMPVWMTRARYGVEKRTWPRRRQVEAARLSIAVSLPERLLAGGVEEVNVQVRNEGRRAILPDGPRSVTLAQRWCTADDRQLGREQLGLNELAFLPQALPRAVRARRRIGVALALYAPPEPGVYRIEVVAHQHGRGRLDETGASQTAVGEIEVVAGPAPAGLAGCVG
jgi:hypothetical protein